MQEKGPEGTKDILSEYKRWTSSLPEVTPEVWQNLHVAHQGLLYSLALVPKQVIEFDQGLRQSRAENDAIVTPRNIIVGVGHESDDGASWEMVSATGSYANVADLAFPPRNVPAAQYVGNEQTQ